MISVVVADDQPVVRQGLRSFFDGDSAITIVGDTGSGPELFGLLEELHPDVLIVGLTLPGIDGLEMTREVARRWVDIRVIILTMCSDEVLVQKALTSGALGYVLKNSTAAELKHAIHEVAAGRRHLSAPIAEQAIEAFVRGGKQPPFDRYNTLTKREQEVLKLAARGLSNAAIAGRLLISPRTVETHRARLMRKLGLRTQTELVRYSLRRGIVPMDE